MLVELGILGLVSLAAYQAMKPGPGVMTPERRLVFRHALNKIDPPLPPEKLSELADLFDAQGLPAYSEILRKRAAMRSRPPEVKAAYRAAFRKAMGSTDANAVRALATALESQGLVGNAAKLRTYAIGLDAMQSAPGNTDETLPVGPANLPLVNGAVVIAQPAVMPGVSGDIDGNVSEGDQIPGDDALEAEFAGALRAGDDTDMGPLPPAVTAGLTATPPGIPPTPGAAPRARPSSGSVPPPPPSSP